MAAGRRGGTGAQSERFAQPTTEGPIGPASSPSSVEQTVARMHPSARRLIVPGVVVIAICGATGYLNGNLPEEWENVALPFVAATVVLFAGVFPLLFWMNRVYLITTRRIVATRGFFTRERREVLHSRANQVVMRRTPGQRLAGSGDVAIVSGDEELFLLADVPSADLVREALIGLMEHVAGTPAHRSRQPEETRRPFDP